MNKDEELALAEKRKGAKDKKFENLKKQKTNMSDILDFLKSTNSGKQIVRAFKGELPPAIVVNMEDDEKNMVMLLLKFNHMINHNAVIMDK